MCRGVLHAGLQVIAVFGLGAVCQNTIFSTLFLREGAGQVCLPLRREFFRNFGFYSAKHERRDLVAQLIGGFIGVFLKGEFQFPPTAQ